MLTRSPGRTHLLCIRARNLNEQGPFEDSTEVLAGTRLTMTSPRRQRLGSPVVALVALLVGCASAPESDLGDPIRPTAGTEVANELPDEALDVHVIPPGGSWEDAGQPSIVRVSNQAFEDPDVRLTATLDGLELFDQSFAVEGQHSVTLFGLNASSGPHTLTVVSDSGARTSQTVVLPAGEQRWLVVDYWYVDPATASSGADQTPGPSLTVFVSDEPVYIA